MTRVVALEKGHDGLTVRAVGEEFDVNLDDPRFKGATWFSTVDKVPAPKPFDPNAQPPGAGPKKGSRVVKADDIA